MNKLIEKLEELFGIDIRALALMRMAFSVCILIHLSDLLPYVRELYSDQGILPRAYVLHFLGPDPISLNLMSGNWVFQALLFLLTAFFTVGLLLGWRTRLCTFMVWILLSSIHNRNPFLLDGGDKLLDILFFWFLFLPWGACYSMDSRRKTYNPPPLRVSSMGSVAYLLQISFFYTFASLLKTGPEWTTQGTAIYYALNVDELCKPFGHVLLQHPLLLHYTTFAVMCLERYGPLFFFIPFKNIYFRLTAILAFVFFHTGILLSMELRLFQWICLIALIGFLPTPFLNRVLGNFDPKSGTPLENQFSIWKPNLFYMPFYLSFIVAFFVVYVFFWNMGGLENAQFRIPPPMKWVGYAFDIRQTWGMFAPKPMDVGWCVMPGKLRNGKTVDIFNSGAPVTWKEPGSILKLDRMYNFNLYYSNMRHETAFYYREPWARYMCSEWNSTHPSDQQLFALDIDYIEKHTLPDYQKPAFHRLFLISYYCFGTDQHPTVSVFKEGELPKS